jgi:hypothetical protein
VPAKPSGILRQFLLESYFVQVGAFGLGHADPQRVQFRPPLLQPEPDILPGFEMIEQPPDRGL